MSSSPPAGPSGGPAQGIALDDRDVFGAAVNAWVAAQAPRQPWDALLAQLGRARSGGPRIRFGQRVATLIAQIGADAFLQAGLAWLGVLETAASGPAAATGYDERWVAIRARWTNHPYLIGLLWALERHPTPAAIAAVAGFAARCYGRGNGSSRDLGREAIVTLSRQGGAGMTELLRLRVRLLRRRELVFADKTIARAAAAAGMSPERLQDLAVPAYGFELGRRVEQFGAYRLELSLAAGRVAWGWRSAAGRALAGTPAAVRREHGPRLRELRQASREWAAMAAAQRNRLERAYLHDRSWEYEAFERCWHAHGVLSPIARGLIWLFSDGARATAALWLDGRWVDQHERPLDWIGPGCVVRLWHPLHGAPEETLAWRAALARAGIAQPFEQAAREIHLLTEAERETGIYSNRMAGHILEQRRFAAAMARLGWGYRPMYDFGGARAASIALPAHGLEAQFWIPTPSGEETHRRRFWRCVLSDQVRFCRPGAAAGLELAGVAPILFSEVMRAANLAVAAASLGRDPAWRDFGNEPYPAPRPRPDPMLDPAVAAHLAEAAAAAAFGATRLAAELSALAEARRDTLAELLPRLRIGAVSAIEDPFLVVRGRLRAYKIHIGSGHILMGPNDQYLCIVPRPQPARRLFLPFEGDEQLAVILSKALMLAEDDQITDQTIVRQIRR